MTEIRSLICAAFAISALACSSTFAESSGNGIPVQSVVVHLLEEADVPAQAAGVLTSLKVREGTGVSKGQLLAQIDDREARLADRTAQVELQAAKEKAENDISLRFAAKAHEVAEAELKRSLDSVERFPKSVSQSQLDVERLNVQKTKLEQEEAAHQAALARYEYKLKEQALAATRLQLAQRKITAPFAGTVAEVFARKGEWIQPGETALRIVSTNKLKAEGFIPASQAGAHLLGAPVRLAVQTDQGVAETFTGKVVFVSPEMDPITEQVRVWAEIENESGDLRPGQRVEMWIEPADGPRVAKGTKSN